MSGTSRAASGRDVLSAVLGLLIIGLGVLGWFASRLELDVSGVPPALDKGLEREAFDLGPGNGADEKPIAQFSATIARPLFHASRRPLEVPVVAPPEALKVARAPAPDAEGLKLVGVMQVGSTKRALIRTAEEPQGRWVAVGDTIAGWKLTAVGDGAVKLEASGYLHELKLHGSSVSQPEPALQPSVQPAPGQQQQGQAGRK